MIDDVYIPGSMSVIAPQYAIGRSKSLEGEQIFSEFVFDGSLLMTKRSATIGEDVYTDANSFIPERWYQFPDMIKNKDAFAPFSTGT